MKGKTISLLILFLLLLPTTQALTITMEGPTTLHGGSDHTYYINITSNEPTNISLTPHIHPNNTGFTTSFSEQSFIVQNTKNILFNITTNPYLIGTYNVSITYSSNIIKDNTPKQTKTITPSTPNIIEEPEEPEEPINKDNTTTPTEPSDNETDTDTTDNTTDDTNTTTQPEQPEPYPTLYIAIAIIFIATIITLFYLYKRQEKEKRKK